MKCSLYLWKEGMNECEAALPPSPALRTGVQGGSVGKEEGKVSSPGSAAEGILEWGSSKSWRKPWTGVAWKYFFQSPKGVGHN